MQLGPERRVRVSALTGWHDTPTHSCWVDRIIGRLPKFGAARWWGTRCTSPPALLAQGPCRRLPSGGCAALATSPTTPPTQLRRSSPPSRKAPSHPPSFYMSGGVSFALSLGWLARQAGRQAGRQLHRRRAVTLPALLSHEGCECRKILTNVHDLFCFTITH